MLEPVTRARRPHSENGRTLTSSFGQRHHDEGAVELAQLEVVVVLHVLAVGAADDDVQARAVPLARLLVLDGDEVGRAQLLGLRRLAGRAADGQHLSAHLGRELHGQVAQAADADDADLLARPRRPSA